MNKHKILDPGATAKALACQFISAIHFTEIERVSSKGVFVDIAKATNPMGNLATLKVHVKRARPCEWPPVDPVPGFKCAKVWMPIIEVSHHDDPEANPESAIRILLRIRLCFQRIDNPDVEFVACTYQVSAPGPSQAQYFSEYSFGAVEKVGSTDEAYLFTGRIALFISYVGLFFEGPGCR